MAGFKLFGFQYASKQDRIDKSQMRSVLPQDDESASTITTMAGAISPMVSGIDLNGSIRSENERIMRYREVAQLPEVDRAVDEIASEAVIFDDENAPPIELNLDNLDGIDDNIKEFITEEFKTVLSLMHFTVKGHSIFRRWYIDGRIHYHKMFDEERPQNGIQEIRYIDPRKIKRIREINKNLLDNDGNSMVLVPSASVNEYYLYSEQGFDTIAGSGNNTNSYQQRALPMTREVIAYADSGLMDSQNTSVVSFLEKAIRAANNLRMMEDSNIIYRLVRSPERRAFYVDTGNLSKQKAEQYVQEIADKHKTKIIYDVQTGEIKNDKRYLAMTEDFWLPRREGSRGTEIQNLEGGVNGGDTDEVEYFKSNLYEALHVPASRFGDAPSVFDSGAEITRDEVRFARFVNRLRSRFNMLFDDLLGTQLILKGIMTSDEWDFLKTNVRYVYQTDNFFSEQAENNIIQQRLAILDMIEPYVGQYFSREFVYKSIMRLNDEDIKDMLTQIMNESQLAIQLAQRKMQIEVAGMPPQIAESTEDDEFDTSGSFLLGEGFNDTTSTPDELSEALVAYLQLQNKAKE